MPFLAFSGFRDFPPFFIYPFMYFIRFFYREDESVPQNMMYAGVKVGAPWPWKCSVGLDLEFFLLHPPTLLRTLATPALTKYYDQIIWGGGIPPPTSEISGQNTIFELFIFSTFLTRFLKFCCCTLRHPWGQGVDSSQDWNPIIDQKWPSYETMNRKLCNRSSFFSFRKDKTVLFKIV